jgi:hypothetical protein
LNNANIREEYKHVMKTPSSGNRGRLIVVVTIVLCVAAAAVWWNAQRQASLQGNATALEELDAARLIEQKNFAVASLENLPNEHTNDGTECVAALTELSEHLRDEPLGPRNLAVARLLMLENLVSAQQSENLQSAFLAAEDAIENSRQREGDQLTVRLLSANLAKLGFDAKLMDDPQRVMQAYSAAADLAPDDPLVWSEMYVATRDFFDEASKGVSRNALKRAWELRPDNIVLLMEWLMVQAETHDATIKKTLTVARRVLQPLAPAIEQRGVNLNSSIEAATAALTSGAADAWTTVLARVRPLVFVVRPDPAYQLDRPRLERHPLEYVIHDFSRNFYERAQLPDPASSNGIPVQFVAAPEGSQLPADSVGRGVLLADYDLDGRLDVITLGEDQVEVLSQESDGTGWRSVVKLTVTEGMNRLVVADLDRDDDVDLILSGTHGVQVLNNQRVGDLPSLTATPQDAAFEILTDVSTVAVADLEHDGDLDLVVASKTGLSLWSNHGDFVFADVSRQSTLPATETTRSAIVPVDWNRDVAIDLVTVGAASAEPNVLENVFHNRFRLRSIEMPSVRGDGPDSLVVADVDGNASWDLLVGGADGISVMRTAISSDGRTRLLAAEPVSDSPTSGLKSWDYDNDGYSDIVAWGSGGLQIYRGVPGGQFHDAGEVFVDLPSAVSTCDFGDIDLDGDSDLVVIDDERVRWYVNDGGNANHWIDITLRAESDPKLPSQRTNNYGIGSLLELKSGAIYQSQTVNAQTTHFGLGQSERADVLRVLFTNGIPQNILTPIAGQHVVADQRILKGSCPYLYTWTGERYEFFTDLLWASPIGLQFAEGVLAVPREWEFLLIPGDRLVEEDGEYRLQITEELWEAAYFDQVRLIAVDHPADVNVYSNEKVGPAEISEFGIHTVADPQTLIAAHDQHGRDVLPLISHRDDQYLRAFDQRFTQGLTEEQIIDLDLGTRDHPREFTLFLTGWVFPTDTSLNVAISQNPAMPSLKPPSLWVPDADGHWKQVIPYTGFPGGKTKTIAVNLSADIFSDGDYRVRLVTNMELYWDEISFTVDERPAEYRLTEMRPVAADLHHRGYSQRIEHPENGPESYDYDEVSVVPRWPPMRGYFTRFGDVTDLVSDSDDLLVVLGAGDEMTVRFRVPEIPPPDGWSRDFLLHNIGWDKDADLNTVLGQTVEPLPFQSMQRYPYPADITRPDTSRYRGYLQTWQSREQNWAGFWKRIHDTESDSTESN